MFSDLLKLLVALWLVFEPLVPDENAAELLLCVCGHF